MQAILTFLKSVARAILARVGVSVFTAEVPSVNGVLADFLKVIDDLSGVAKHHEAAADEHMSVADEALALANKAKEEVARAKAVVEKLKAVLA